MVGVGTRINNIQRNKLHYLSWGSQAPPFGISLTKRVLVKIGGCESEEGQHNKCCVLLGPHLHPNIEDEASQKRVF